MVPYKDQQAIPANSPLYNEDELPEFETEYSHSIHMTEQALSKMLKDYNFQEQEFRPQANALPPSDSIVLEF